MKKAILALLFFVLLLGTACSTGKNGDNTEKFTELDKYIFEVDEYTSLDYDCADAFYARSNDN